MNHASHGYFADRYGFEVVGTVIPSVGTGETPTAKQLADLTAAIRASGARGHLRGDRGEPRARRADRRRDRHRGRRPTCSTTRSRAPDGVAPTYIDMMKYDTRRIVEALR